MRYFLYGMILASILIVVGLFMWTSLSLIDNDLHSDFKYGQEIPR